MLSPLGKVLAYYAAGSFPLALFCAIAFFDRPAELDPAWGRRLLTRARWLALAGPIHPIVALTALGVSHDALSAEDLRPAAARRTIVTSWASLAVSVAAMFVVFLSAGT